MPDKNFVTLDGDRWGRGGGALRGSDGAARQSFTTPITSFGAPRRGHPCQRRGKWKSINKDKTRLSEALICRITFLICVKYHRILSLCSGGTHECTRTHPEGDRGSQPPWGVITVRRLPRSWVNPSRVPNWAVRDDRISLFARHSRGRRQTETGRERNVNG